MKRNAVVSLLLAFSLLSGCAAGAAEPSGIPPETLDPQWREEGLAIQDPAEPVESLASPDAAEAGETSANALAMALLREECAQKEGNVILSPLSIQTALAMASEGASGEAREALEALGLTGEQSGRLSQTDGDSVLSIVNSMWFNEKLSGKVSQGFKDILTSEYGAEEGFFAPGSDASVNEINGWVKEKTHEKIDSIVTKDALSENSLAVIINALYFDGKWTEPFERQARPDKFYTPHGIETAQLMADQVKTYFAHGGFTGFSKSYEDGYEFIGILPEELGLDLGALDIDAFLSSETREYDVDVEIPKFELEYSNSLRETLTELGLGSLFEEGSMNGMLTDEAVALGDFAQVDDVLHKTYMKMYEAGTEAAAVTGVIYTYSTTAVAPRREVKRVFLNRPFAFLIREVDSGRIVFCGAVNSVE